jgi:hypothetical protein
MTTMSVMALNKIYCITNEKDTVKLTEQVSQNVGQSQIGNTSCWDTLIQSVLWNSSAKVEWSKTLKNERGEPYAGYTTAGNVTE